MLRAILMARPLVAVPTYPRLEAGRVRGWADEGIGLPARYIDALHRAGGQEACFVPEAWTDADSEALVARVDGLLLIGGGDLDPSTYRATPDTRIYGVDPARDACELSLVRAAIAAALPTLWRSVAPSTRISSVGSASSTTAVPASKVAAASTTSTCSPARASPRR
jgi:Peptidase C26